MSTYKCVIEEEEIGKHEWLQFLYDKSRFYVITKKKKKGTRKTKTMGQETGPTSSLFFASYYRFYTFRLQHVPARVLPHVCMTKVVCSMASQSPVLPNNIDSHLRSCINIYNGPNNVRQVAHSLFHYYHCHNCAKPSFISPFTSSSDYQSFSADTMMSF